MPSYRVTLVVGALQPGVNPQRILPAAKEAALELAVVEAADLQVVAGQARILIRFAADEGEIAAQIGQHVASTVSTLASLTQWSITERVKNLWVAV
jgi:hypothetical protein